MIKSILLHIKRINKNNSSRNIIPVQIDADIGIEWAYHKRIMSPNQIDPKYYTVTHINSGYSYDKTIKLTRLDAYKLRNLLDKKCTVYWDGMGEIPKAFKTQIIKLTKEFFKQ